MTVRWRRSTFAWQLVDADHLDDPDAAVLGTVTDDYLTLPRRVVEAEVAEHGWPALPDTIWRPPPPPDPVPFFPWTPEELIAFLDGTPEQAAAAEASRAARMADAVRPEAPPAP